MRAHETAIIHPKAEIDSTVEVGPFVIIEEGTAIGGGTKMLSHVVVKKGTSIGRNCEIHHGSVLGDTPQDTKFKGEESYLKIGDGNVIREFATLHRGSGEGAETVIGDNNMLMVQTHVAHNCRIGNNVVMANLATLGGFAQVEDSAFFGGMAGAHQFVRVGTMAMVGGGSVLLEDVPPYMTVSGGHRPPVCSLNTIGLMRNGLSEETRREIKRAYRIMFRSGEVSLTVMIARMEKELIQTPEVAHLIEFLRTTKRGICRGNRSNAKCDSE